MVQCVQMDPIAEQHQLEIWKIQRADNNIHLAMAHQEEMARIYSQGVEIIVPMLLLILAAYSLIRFNIKATVARDMHIARLENAVDAAVDAETEAK